VWWATSQKLINHIASTFKLIEHVGITHVEDEAIREVAWFHEDIAKEHYALVIGSFNLMHAIFSSQD